MTDERFRDLVAEGYTSRQIGVMCHRSHTSVLDRAGRLGLNLPKRKPPRCRVCGERRSSEFYRGQPYRCKGCWAERSRERWRENRTRILEALGGSCSLCGFGRYRTALHIHHTDPAKKDRSSAHIGHWSWARIEREIADCVLLCANCHAALHNGELGNDAVALSAWKGGETTRRVTASACEPLDDGS